MDGKRYHRLNRSELLQLLIEESERNEYLERRLEQAREIIASRELMIDNAGSIAEASLALNGVFESAQDACDQYMENVWRQTLEQNKVNAIREAGSRKRAAQIIADATQHAEWMEARVRAKCERMIALAGGDVDAFRRKVNAY